MGPKIRSRRYFSTSCLCKSFRFQFSALALIQSILGGVAPFTEAIMAEDTQKISIRPDGPIVVQGGVPLVHKTPVTSEHGEPLTWRKDRVWGTQELYRLCRCGHSNLKPFCDGSHEDYDFDGTEAADPGSIDQRSTTYTGTQLVMKDDRSLCMQACFCGNRVTNVWKMIQKTSDTQVRAALMAMVERCPSGALSFSLEPEGDLVEPDLPKEVVVIPDGPLWVSGGISIERADGQPLETRNRVTLCRCGASKIKPLCDGTHKDVGFKAV